MASQAVQYPPHRPWLRLRPSFPPNPNPVATSAPIVPSPNLPPFPKTFTYRPFPPPPSSLPPIILTPPSTTPLPLSVPELPPDLPVEAAPPETTLSKSQEVKQPNPPPDPIPNSPDRSLLLPSLAHPIPKESEKLDPPSLSQIHVIENDHTTTQSEDLNHPPSPPPPPPTFVLPLIDPITKPAEEEKASLLNIITSPKPAAASPWLKELKFSSSPFQPSVVVVKDTRSTFSASPKSALPVKELPPLSPPFPSPMITINTRLPSAPPSPETKNKSQDSSSAPPPPSPLSLPPPLFAPQIHPKTKVEGNTATHSCTGEKWDSSRMAQMRTKENKSMCWEGYLDRGVIKMGGENIGAVMETGLQKDASSPSSGVQQRERGGGRRDGGRRMMRAFTNSNVQGVNNSIFYNSSCTLNDPGIKIKFKRKGRVFHSDSDRS